MARVRSRETLLHRMVSSAPVAVYALDAERRIIYGNAALGELLGVDPEALLGQRCDFCTSSAGAVTLADVAASLSPPAEVLAGRLVVAQLSLLHCGGQLLPRQVTFAPLGSRELRPVGALAIVGELMGGVGPPSESMQLHGRLWELQREALRESELDELVGCSPAIQRVREQIELAARGPLRVLVHGPSGSGREHVARFLHRRGNRAHSGVMVPLACPLMDAELLQTTIADLLRQANESGSVMERGRVSGDEAEQVAPTLLLLEVDQLSAEAQTELAGLFALPGFELYTIATAASDLTRLAGAGRFRSDLAHVLSTLAIELPPLAQRREDIALLSQYFLEKFNAVGGRQLTGFTSEALDELAGFPWPENVDQLSEMVEAACRRAGGPLVDVLDLPDEIRAAALADAHPRRVDEPIQLDDFLASIERELIVRALRRSKGNRSQAARLLGVHRARLLRRLEHFGLQ